MARATLLLALDSTGTRMLHHIVRLLLLLLLLLLLGHSTLVLVLLVLGHLLPLLDERRHQLRVGFQDRQQLLLLFRSGLGVLERGHQLGYGRLRLIRRKLRRLTLLLAHLLRIGNHSTGALYTDTARSWSHSAHHLVTTHASTHHATLHWIRLLRLLLALHHARQIRSHSRRVLLSACVRIPWVTPLVHLGHHVLATSSHYWTTGSHRHSAHDTRLLLVRYTHSGHTGNATDSAHVTAGTHRPLHHRWRHLTATRIHFAEAGVRCLLSSRLFLNLFQRLHHIRRGLSFRFHSHARRMRAAQTADLRHRTWRRRWTHSTGCSDGTDAARTNHTSAGACTSGSY